MQTPRAKQAHRPRDQTAALVPRAELTKPPAAAQSSPVLASSASARGPAAAAGGTATEQHDLLSRARRQVQGPGFSSFDFRGGRPTTETEFIAWGPTGDEEALESNTFPGVFGPTTVAVVQTRKTTVATATTTTATATSVPLQTKGVTEPLDPGKRIPAGVSTMEPPTSPGSNGKDIQPPRILGETSGHSPSHSCPFCPCRVAMAETWPSPDGRDLSSLWLSAGHAGHPCGRVAYLSQRLATVLANFCAGTVMDRGWARTGEGGGGGRQSEAGMAGAGLPGTGRGRVLAAGGARCQRE
uniref:AJAP1/PANP C-terminal domain-containing protein n=1 Tax=Oryctolagus cuniculus TaxID=9986 RepID=A0A5F9CQF8_RABIT